MLKLYFAIVIVANSFIQLDLTFSLYIILFSISWYSLSTAFTKQKINETFELCVCAFRCSLFLLFNLNCECFGNGLKLKWPAAWKCLPFTDYTNLTILFNNKMFCFFSSSNYLVVCMHLMALLPKFPLLLLFIRAFFCSFLSSWEEINKSVIAWYHRDEAKMLHISHSWKETKGIFIESMFRCFFFVLKIQQINVCVFLIQAELIRKP